MRRLYSKSASAFRMTIAMATLLLLALVTKNGLADDVAPTTLKGIGGKWYVSSTEPAIYYYRDGSRYLDLFSYHAKDSNKDGITNVIIHHDATPLIVDSQGYPNHPTAIFPNSGNPNQILVQKFQFRFPLEPKLSEQITRLPMGVGGAYAFEPEGGLRREFVFERT